MSPPYEYPPRPNPLFNRTCRRQVRLIATLGRFFGLSNLLFRDKVQYDRQRNHQFDSDHTYISCDNYGVVIHEPNSTQDSARVDHNLQDQFSIYREKRQYTLNKLDEMETWFDEGMKLSMDEMARHLRQSKQKSDNDPNPLLRAYRDQSLVWNAALTKHYALASQYDPLYKSGSDWDEDAQPIPEDLAHLVLAFGQEVMRHVQHLSESSGDKFVLKNSQKLIDLSVSGISAIERVRQLIMMDSKQSALRKNS